MGANGEDALNNQWSGFSFGLDKNEFPTSELAPTGLYFSSLLSGGRLHLDDSTFDDVGATLDVAMVASS